MAMCKPSIKDVHNPHLSTFTWFRKNPIKKSRLDFFLISNELLSLVENICIKPGYRTDHSIVILELRLSNFNKGKGFWKFRLQATNSSARSLVSIEKSQGFQTVRCLIGC